ncbi:MAG TPA: YCF48-related protein [Candidatus Dormibacteraeota bacterium]|nr:YCF48-related protein [Candidatus Dormibacteraeota bacterium]
MIEDLIRDRMHEALDIALPSPDLERRVVAAVRAHSEAPIRPSWRLQVAAALAIVVLGLGFGAVLRSIRHSVPNALASPRPSPTVAANSQSSSLSPIHFVGTSTLRLINRSHGWAITTTQILSTSDGGLHWTNRTPLGFSTSSIRGAFFLDNTHAWLAAAANGSLVLYRTADGGMSWTTSRLAPLNTAYTERSAPAYVDFADSQHGWVVMVCATACPFAELYRTTDGGVTWVKLSIPEGNPIRFASPSDGWTYTGSDHGQLYVTHDAGASWQSEHLASPPGFETWQPGYELPTFTDRLDGVLPVQLLSQKAFTVSFYVTSDGGRTWRSKQTLPALSTSPMELPEIDVVSTNLWIAVYRNQILRTEDRGQTWSAVSTSGGPTSEVDFVNGQAGWGRMERSEGNCGIVDGVFPNGTPPQNCKQFADLLGTTDGGRTWTKIDLVTS